MKRYNTPDGMNSKQRSRKRRNEAAALRTAELRKQGASCTNCAHKGRRHMDAPGKLICELHSDFHGYVTVEPTKLCTDWKGQTP